MPARYSQPLARAHLLLPLHRLAETSRSYRYVLCGPKLGQCNVCWCLFVLRSPSIEVPLEVEVQLQHAFVE